MNNSKLIELSIDWPLSYQSLFLLSPACKRLDLLLSQDPFVNMNIINDPFIKDFIRRSNWPSDSTEIDDKDTLASATVNPNIDNPINPANMRGK